MLNSFIEKKNRIAAFLSFGKQKKNDDSIDAAAVIMKTCPSCEYQATLGEFAHYDYVCPQCNYHIRLSATERIKLLFDEDSFKEMFGSIETPIPPKKEDALEYGKKLKTAQASTKMNEAVVCGIGNIDEIKVAAAVMDSRFLMGSMGTVVGDKITKTIEYATRKNLPLLIVSTSGGARMQEGILSLVQMAKTSAALKRHNEKGLLYLSLLTNPTTGGVSASFAMLGDIILSEPDALIGFAGKRVIERTIQEELPPEFQRSEFVLEKGFIDLIVERSNLKPTIARLLHMHS